jgi:hypothetical protein
MNKKLFSHLSNYSKDELEVYRKNLEEFNGVMFDYLSKNKEKLPPEVVLANFVVMILEFSIMMNISENRVEDLFKDAKEIYFSMKSDVDKAMKKEKFK